MSLAASTQNAAQTITIRSIKPKFQASRSSFWFGGNPFLTHMTNVLSFQFPSGEEMFVKAVTHFKDQVQDKELKRAIVAFAGQELLHSRLHEEFNEWIASRVPDAKNYCDALAEASNRRSAKSFKQNPMLPLAVTVALEHLTAIMAANFLRRTDISEQAHPEVRALLIWHAIEEIEHKNVAYDVYLAVNGSYLMRAIAMLGATCVLTGQTIYYMTKLLRKDGELTNLKAFWEFMKISFGRKGFFTTSLKAYFHYFKPNFHPSQHDDQLLVAYWSEKLAEATPVRVTGQVSYASPGAS